MAELTPPDADSLRLELQEALTTFRHQIVLLMQGLGFVVTADSILLGYGFAQRLSSILLVASLMPMAGLFIYIQVMSGLVPICYVAIRLERKLSLHKMPFIGTWAKMRKDLPFSTLADFSELEDSKISDSILNVSLRFLLRDMKPKFLLLAFVLQLCLFAISTITYHYRFM